MARFFPKSPVAILLVGGTAGAIVGACVAMAAQPNMQAALGSLQAARAELVQATPNKGGHRERAIQLSSTGDRRDQGRHRLRRPLMRCGCGTSTTRAVSA